LKPGCVHVQIEGNQSHVYEGFSILDTGFGQHAGQRAYDQTDIFEPVDHPGAARAGRLSGNGFARTWFLKNAWKQIALHIYQAGTQDAALAEVLKKSNVQVHENPPASVTPTPAPGTTPSAPPKPAVVPIKPATP